MKKTEKQIIQGMIAIADEMKTFPLFEMLHDVDRFKIAAMLQQNKIIQNEADDLYNMLNTINETLETK